MNERFDITGRRALVTGGCRGIGAAIALAFRDRGADVVVHGRGDGRARDFAAAHGFRFLAADLADLDQVAPLAAAALAELGGLDILVNNAGMEVNATVGHLDPRAVHTQLTVDLEAPILLTHHLVDALKASGHGCVINVSSIHGTVPAYANAVYCAAKGGLELFTRTLAVELGPAGVRVNSLAPGAVETDMNREILDEIDRHNFAEWIPLGRVGTVDEIADPAVFLASEAARYVTGATLTVDGGYSQHLVRYRMGGPEQEAER
ncbi:MAG: SDR family oxidoreductase [Actinobacteria bacterium]|nr:SDR family oxidoreductase [Actinomycetota bacterium]